MYSQAERMTPAHARAILDHKNPRNRPINRARVAQKLADMRDGTFLLNPQGVSFDPEGNLLDGQHTLLAIVEFGQAVNLYVHPRWPHEVHRTYPGPDEAVSGRREEHSDRPPRPIRGPRSRAERDRRPPNRARAARGTVTRTFTLRRSWQICLDDGVPPRPDSRA